jgi:protein-tyrosine phosphatase
MAQVVLAARLAAAGIDAVVDSTGVSDEEWGNPIDPRARRVLEQAGYAVPRHRARRVEPFDLAERDLILPMTYRHFRALERLATRSAAPVGQLRMLRSFDPAFQGRPSPAADIDDPWYGGMGDFVRALGQIEAAIPGVVAWAERDQGHGDGAYRE